MSDKSKPAETTTILTLAEKAHRPSFVIADELDAAKAKFAEMETRNGQYKIKRDRALARREKLASAWAKENPDDPFDEDSYSPPATVPPPDSPEGREFHRQHYVIGRLAAELEASKKAEVS